MASPTPRSFGDRRRVFQFTGFLRGCEQDTANPANWDAFTGYRERDRRDLGHLIPLERI